MKPSDCNLSHSLFHHREFAKRCFSVLLLVCAGISLPITAAAQAGQLDKTFGTGGIFNTGLSGSSATAVALQSNGDILVAGQFATPSSGQLPGVIRLTANGTIDTSFGTGGVAIANPHAGGGEQAAGVVIQTDGKIVVALATFNGDLGPVLELFRLNGNGTLDTSFGSAKTGLALLVRGSDSAFIGLQPDGKIIVGGGFLMARVNSDGSLDSSFGMNGIATLISQVPSPFNPLILGQPSTVLLSNGKILVGASRYNPNGSLDTTFGTLGTAANIASGTVRVQSDGKIVAVGMVNTKVRISQIINSAAQLAFTTGFELTRFTATGSIDTTFGTKGGVTTDFNTFGTPFTAPADIAIQSNGDIIVAGQAEQQTNNNNRPPAAFVLGRYTSTGQLDTTFGSGGRVFTSFGSNQAGITAIALDAQGKLVVVGNVLPARVGTPGSITVARYLTQ
jgi:uncharacterized delta-60 repeat protein